MFVFVSLTNCFDEVTRVVHGRRRRNLGLPIIALVGYTNSGKSTLLNAFTQGERSHHDRKEVLDVVAVVR